MAIIVFIISVFIICTIIIVMNILIDIVYDGWEVQRDGACKEWPSRRSDPYKCCLGIRVQPTPEGLKAFPLTVTVTTDSR